jgi:hypothetical protein
VRVLTRDASSARAKQFGELKGVELFQGDLTKEDDVRRALQVKNKNKYINKTSKRFLYSTL